MTLRLVNYLPISVPEEAADWRLGALVGDVVVDLAENCALIGEHCGCAASVVDLLACPECQAAARRALVAADLAGGLDLSEARLFAPVPVPGKLFCVAGNYASHIQEGAKGQTREMHKSDQATPRIFMKPSTNTVCATGDPVLVTRTSTFVDYEGELAVIIGRSGKYIKAEDALRYVGGITCMNDISERRLQVWERPETRPWDRFFDWLNGKWFDNFAPMGPCAVPLGDVEDLQNLKLQTRLNGEVKQDASTADMIFTVAELIEYLSQMVTLQPGDVIATGTPAGVGHAQELAMKPGDVIEVEIEGVGTLRNPVEAEG